LCRFGRGMLRLRGLPVRRCASTLAPHVPAVEVALSRGGAPIPVRNIYCIGRNFTEHARELGNPVPTEEPVIFLKSNAALRGLDASPIAFSDETFHFEAELVLLVGKHVPLGSLVAGEEERCLQAAGLGLDLTRRGKQSELKAAGLPWTVAKSFAGSAIVAPLLTLDGSFRLSDVSFELAVNGDRRQSGHVNQMIFDIPFQLRYLNQLAPLLPGDLLFTGTPSGVGEFRQGDTFILKFLSGPTGKAAGPFRGVL